MAETQDPQEELKDLLFHVRRSIRYHEKRRGFLEGFQKIKSLVAIVVGSAAMVSLMNNIGNLVLVIAALAVGILSAIDLVFSVGDKAREHSDLRRRFIELEKEIIGLIVPTTNQIRELEQKRRTIEADEPPILRVLDSICHNEQLYADRYAEEHFLDIKGYQRLLAQLLSIRPHRIKQIGQKEIGERSNTESITGHLSE